MEGTLSLGSAMAHDAVFQGGPRLGDVTGRQGCVVSILICIDELALYASDSEVHEREVSVGR